ncbi:MAG: glycosyl hydrolase-related protein, partial [bacterium]
ADRGRHSIPYALYPHTGGWQDANSQLRGREYNDPVMVVKANGHAGRLGKRHSFFAAGADNVVVSTIKRSEDGEGFVMRLVETEGRDSKAVIEFTAKPKKVIETNLVERELGELPLPKETTLAVPLGHYEIKSIKLVF